MLGQPPGLARALHLDDADARPEQIHEAAARALLEPRAFGAAVGAVALEQPVQESLRFAALRPCIAAPGGGELAEPAADLLALERHRAVRA